MLRRARTESIQKHMGPSVGPRRKGRLELMLIDLLRNAYGRAYGMERELPIKLMRVLVDAGFIANDQRADAAIEKVALEAGINREQLKAALKYARAHKWVAETNKAAWSVVTQAGIDAATAD
jgi:uncharacterized protein (DUF433 family)